MLLKRNAVSFFRISKTKRCFIFSVPMEVDPAAQDETADDSNNVDYQRSKRAFKERELLKVIKSKIDVGCFSQEKKPSDVTMSATKDELFTKMKQISTTADKNLSRQTYIYYIMGQICYRLNRKDKKYYVRIQLDLGKQFSLRYCQSLIKFYNVCVNFPSLKYSGVAIRNILNNITAVESRIRRDTDTHFWLRN